MSIAAAYERDGVALYCGDCREVLAELGVEASAVVCDPPYGLKFMGKAWDHGVPGAAFWESIMASALPGAHLMAFGGTRTWHRLACGIEDAGWELRDTLCWLYGQGFPKSHNVSRAIDKAAGAVREVVGTYMGASNIGKQADGKYGYNPGGGENHAGTVDITVPATSAAREWDGWGTGLKPAWEPVVLARKPFKGTVAANVVRCGCGAINVDACRIAHDGRGIWGDHGQEPANHLTEPGSDGTTMGKGWQKPGSHRNPSGRWPANLVLSHLAECRRVGEKRVATNWRDVSKHKRQATSSWNPHAQGKSVSHLPADADGRETVAAWECVEGCPVRMLDEQSGERRSSGIFDRDLTAANNWTPGSGGCSDRMYSDTGGASRFFYCAKASRRERFGYCKVCEVAFAPADKGEHEPHARHCETCGVDYAPTMITNAGGVNRRVGAAGKDGRPYWYTDAHKGHKTTSNLVFHPTQKPESLMRWLVRLVTPPGGVVLDPFCGSGSTLVACIAEGFPCVGIDSDPHAIEIAAKRLDAALDARAGTLAFAEAGG